MLRIDIQSSSGKFPHLDNPELYAPKDQKYRYERGVVVLGRCAGVDYQTYVKRDGSPVGVIDSDDPAYWFVTLLLLDALGENEWPEPL